MLIAQIESSCDRSFEEVGRLYEEQKRFLGSQAKHLQV
jgi:hypothetical protein